MTTTKTERLSIATNYAQKTAKLMREDSPGVCCAFDGVDLHVQVARNDQEIIPWVCSLPVGHDGEHEVHVDYVFTDGRAPQRNVKVHAWTDHRITVKPWVTAHV